MCFDMWTNAHVNNYMHTDMHVQVQHIKERGEQNKKSERIETKAKRKHKKTE